MGTDKGGGFGHVAYVNPVTNGVASLDKYNLASTGTFTATAPPPQVLPGI